MFATQKRDVRRRAAPHNSWGREWAPGAEQNLTVLVDVEGQTQKTQEAAWAYIRKGKLGDYIGDHDVAGDMRSTMNLFPVVPDNLGQQTADMRLMMNLLLAAPDNLGQQTTDTRSTMNLLLVVPDNLE